ncbi:MAG: hypothetical protein AAFR11_01155 [Pseudomonadota bacterium]
MRTGGHGIWISVFIGVLVAALSSVEAFYRHVGCHSITACRRVDVVSSVVKEKTTAVFGASVTYGAFYYMPAIDPQTLNLTSNGATTFTGNAILFEDMLTRTDDLQRMFYFTPAELFTKQPLKDDARQRNYFSNVFDAPHDVVRATAMYEARERDIYLPAPRRFLEKRSAALIEPRARLREAAARARSIDGASLRWWIERNAGLEQPPVAGEAWRSSVGRQRARLISPFRPSVQAGNALRRISDVCAARGIACHIVLAPTHEIAAEALAADPAWAAFRAEQPGFCWLDMNGPRAWPSGAFRDDLHLIRPWELYYRKMLMTEVLGAATADERAPYVMPGSEAACAGFVEDQS